MGYRCSAHLACITNVLRRRPTVHAATGYPALSVVLLCELQPHAVAGAIYTLLHAAGSLPGFVALSGITNTCECVPRSPAAEATSRRSCIGGSGGVLGPRRGRTHILLDAPRH